MIKGVIEQRGKTDQRLRSISAFRLRLEGVRVPAPEMDSPTGVRDGPEDYRRPDTGIELSRLPVSECRKIEVIPHWTSVTCDPENHPGKALIHEDYC